MKTKKAALKRVGLYYENIAKSRAPLARRDIVEKTIQRHKVFSNNAHEQSPGGKPWVNTEDFFTCS